MIAFHEYADIFPLLEGHAFEHLVEDIRDNGQLEPISVFEGKILDGRNRFRACQALRVQPRVVELDDVDPLAFVVSKNLHRRHLTTSQRGIVAARLATLVLGDNQHQRRGKLTIEQASTLMKVGHATVERAKLVRDGCIPSVQALVDHGRLSISAAAAVAALPAREQVALSEAGARAIVARARTVRSHRGRSGRSNYSTLWQIVDRICGALEEGKLSAADLAAGDLREAIRRAVHAPNGDAGRAASPGVDERESGR